MRVWGFEAEGGDHIDKHLPEIREQYAQIFKERFYFVSASYLYGNWLFT